jgi:hypothetical protein
MAFEVNVKENTDSFFNFAKEGFKYNLQVLPDVLMSSTLLFSVLFQSPPLAFLGTAMILLQFIHKGLAAFTQTYIPNMSYNPTNFQQCSGRFPGAGYSSLFNMARGSIFSATNDGWPSYYSTFIGFIAGWVGAIPTLYAAELKASPEKRAASAAGLVILVCLILMVMLFRITSECEGFMSTAMGLLAGFVLGLLLVTFAAWISDRRATNLLGLPLIRNKVATGQPIYVCERPQAQAQQPQTQSQNGTTQ